MFSEVIHENWTVYFGDHILKSFQWRITAITSWIFIYFLWLPVEVELSFQIISSQGIEEDEAEAFDVSLTKNAQGLGITIAGYVGDKNSGEKF